MGNLGAHLENPTLFAGACETSQGVFEPHVKRYEANAVLSPCEATEINVVTCKNPDRDLFIEEVNGLGFDNVQISQNLNNLPSFIPIIDRRMFGVDADLIDTKLVGVSLKDIFSSAPWKKRDLQTLPKNLVIRNDIISRPLFAGKDVVLFSSGRDLLIEKVWQQFNSLDFVRLIKSMGFIAVTGFNFSIFLCECPLSHAINLKKSLETVRLFHEAGIQVIPHIYFAHTHHITRWIKWLRENPTVSAITINCQFRTAENAKILTEGIQYLFDGVGRELKVILEGPDIRKLTTLFRLYPNSIITALKAVSMAPQFYKEYRCENGEIKKVDNGAEPIHRRFNTSVQSFASYIKTLSIPLLSDAERKLLVGSQNVQERKTHELLTKRSKLTN